MPDSLWPTWPIKAALVSLALLIDAAVGDPASLPHPGHSNRPTDQSPLKETAQIA